MANPVGNEIIYALGITPNGQPAATTEPFTLAQVAALASNFSNDSPQAVTATVGTTLTAAQLLAGLINRTGPTAAFTDTTDIAANIAAAGQIGQSFYIDIKNATVFAQTLQGGTGVTIATAVVPPLTVAEYLVTITSATAVTFNHVMTVPLSYIAPQTLFASATNTTGFALTAATQEAGAQDIALQLTGTLGGAANVQSDTAANIVAAIPNARAGQSYRYRIINSSGANFAWTLTTNTGITLTGTMSIAQNTWRDFYVTLTSLTAVAIQSIGTGTNS